MAKRKKITRVPKIKITPIRIEEKISEKKKGVALALSFLGLLGIAGVHRIYVGKVGTGILWLCMGGLFLTTTIVDIVTYLGKVGTGILWLCMGGLLLIRTIVDIVKIADGTFKDKSGAFVRK